MRAWEAAIELDPSLVSAWYAKAAGLYQRVFNQWSDDPGADMQACREAAERCVSLDTNDSAAHEICGFERLVSGRLDDAISHLQRAVELNPSNAQARSELGQALVFSERIPEGIAELEEALGINPNGDPAWSVRGSLAYAHFLLDELDTALTYCRQFVAITPTLAMPRAMLCAYLASAGQLDEARSLQATLVREIPGFNAASVVQAYAALAPEQGQKVAAALNAAGFDLAAPAPDRQSGSSSS
jgi:tetratricopeptide (TPR) repeat protein